MSSLLHLLLTQSDAVEPWFNPERFGSLYGGIGGAVLGILGGVFGSFGSQAAQSGRHRSLVLGGMTIVALACMLSLFAGLMALLFGQPYGIWYPLGLIGLIGSVVFFGLLPVMRKRYAEAEGRRMDAAALRRS
jgi:hypothetical protein